MTQMIQRAPKRAISTLVLAALLAAGVALLAALGYAPGVATAQAQYTPQNVTPPTISGDARVGQTLTATTGTWNGAPTSFSFQWLRCNPAGEGCAAIPGATANTYVVQAPDQGNTLRVQVVAANATGSSQPARSAQTAVVGPAGPGGQTPLPGGGISIPVTEVSPPERLIIDRVVFTPNPVRSRANPIQVRVSVRDTRGFYVRGALVFLRSTPLLTSVPPEQQTQTDGWVTFNIQPTGEFPLRNGYNVQFFVRARKQGDNLLAGVSTRRLVQVRTARR